MESSSDTYNEVLERIGQLNGEQTQQLLEQIVLRRAYTRAQLKAIIKLLEDQSTAQSEHSILELQGLVKELWQGVESQEYVHGERDSWNG